MKYFAIKYKMHGDDAVRHFAVLAKNQTEATHVAKIKIVETHGATAQWVITGEIK